MSYQPPMYPHGIVCARCSKRVLPGGNDDQRIYHLRLDTPGPDMPPWETPEACAEIYELVCRSCYEEAQA